LWYVAWTIIIEGCTEIETEIRTGNFENLKVVNRNFILIYSIRWIPYFIYGVISFLLIAIVSNFDFFVEIIKELFSFQGICTLAVHMFISYMIFLVVVCMTVIFHRIQTVVNFVYTVSIFASGMIFQIPRKLFSYGKQLELISQEGILSNELIYIFLLVSVMFIISRKIALKKFYES
jgi:hypothetical protein